MLQDNSLCLSAYDELYIIDLDKVLYLQADDHYTDVYYVTGSHFLVPFGLVKIEARLAVMDKERYCLMRLGRKYIVNMRRVFRINTAMENIYLVDDTGNNIALHISKPVLRSLIDSMNNRIVAFAPTKKTGSHENSLS